MSNYLLEVMEAVTLATAVGSNQQLSDAQASTLDVKIEQQVVNTWKTQLYQYTKQVTDWAQKCADNPTNKSYQDELAKAQARLSQAQTQQQTDTQSADSGTQAEQNQTGQDSSNLQQKVQLEAAINSVSQTLASALGAR
jgi:hypothetical protein